MVGEAVERAVGYQRDGRVEPVADSIRTDEPDRVAGQLGERLSPRPFDGATVEDAWAAVVGLFPRLAPGRPSVRFARNGDYAEPATALRDNDEVAFIPPVSGGSEGVAGDPAGRRRILELRETPFPATILADLEARLATPEDGAVVGFVGRTRVSPGTPAPVRLLLK